MDRKYSSGRNIDIAAARRGGLFAQERRWLQLCTCGHSKRAHHRPAHPSKRQTGPCKAALTTACGCQEFRFSGEYASDAL